MEGLLLVPPDRNSIIARSLWKTRFVTLGPAPLPTTRPQATRSTSSASSRLNSSLRQLKFGSRNTSQVSVEQLAAEPLWIFIYKHKGDHVPVSCHPVSSVISCAIHDYAYRKTNSAQPTLIVTLQNSDPKCVRQARRLSQSTGNSSCKGQSTTLLFRSVPASPRSIHDWLRALQEQLRPEATTNSQFSISDKSSRPSTSGTRPAVPKSQGSYVSTTSSHHGSTLSIHTSHTGVSSPNSISPQNPLKSFEASSSLLSEDFRAPSPLRPDSPSSPTSAATAPAAPRQETILDRAFKMNCIPGADQSLSAADSTMNSIARFEALMADLETKRARAAAERRPSAIDEDAEDPPSSPTTAELISPSAQRALEYISSGASTVGRSTHKRGGTTTTTTTNRRSRPTSLALPSSTSTSSSSTTIRPPATSGPTSDNNNTNANTDRRRSSVSTTNASITTTNKRLSLADFHRRLSSTSSLILARTGTASSRSSGVSDASFHCVGEDDGGNTWGVITATANPPPSAAAAVGTTLAAGGGGRTGPKHSFSGGGGGGGGSSISSISPGGSGSKR
ncbi:MAG: hypothetical protein M1816_000234 [Peltula sp. TS41687]|nr:MAG: hypothetical protein M1816_000234 [Peltula sp. TS41687]